MIAWFKTIKEFWREAPALHAGACLALGIGMAVVASWELLLPLAILICGGKRTILFVILAFCFGYLSIPILHEEKEGIATFHIESLKIKPSPFYKTYQYKGIVKEFKTEKGVSHNLPCFLSLSLKKKRPLANGDYLIRGTMKRLNNTTFSFKPAKGAVWEKIPGSFSCAEWRFQAKEKVKAFIQQRIPHRKSATFLAALATGDVDDRLLILDFGKVGLQHLLAVSGFHFALIAGFAGFFLRMFLGRKLLIAALLILMSLLFFFIGNAPSVMRAFIAISLVLLAQLLKLRLSSINALGIALVIELVCDPLLVTQVGFHLSFLATLSIFVLYPLMQRLLSFFLKKRTLETVMKMSEREKHIYLASALLRKLLSLNLAIHCFTVPIILFFFHKFPLLSLGYNLFFPLGTALSLFLLLLGSLCSGLLSPLGTYLYWMNSHYTAVLLKTTENSPAFLDYSLRIEALPALYVILFLMTLFLWGIKKYKDPLILPDS